MNRPKTISKDLDHYIHSFTSVKVNKRGENISPHKPSLMLALLELFESKEIDSNRFPISPKLFNHFKAIFDVVRSEGDRCDIFLPFYHLKNDKFWHLKASSGNEEILPHLTSIKNQKKFHELIEFAYLDDELFELLQMKENREILRRAILEKWFPQKKSKTILSVLSQERETSFYQNFIEQIVDKQANTKAKPDVSEKVRSEAFRRSVREAYDLRCAATGLRIIFPDGRPLVEAVHLIPFSESCDDDPRNGMTLTPTYHKLLDENIIAPGPDLKWHISPLIDSRIADNRELHELKSKVIILPYKRQYYPSKEALEWRMEKLLK